MNRLRAILAFTVVLPVALTACSDEDPVSPGNTITGSGVLQTEVRTVSAFHSFNLAAAGDVVVTQGASQRVSITVDDNILPLLTTTVTGGSLAIGVQPGAQISDYDLTVELTMIDIQRMSISGAGTITATDTLQIDSLTIDISGAATADVDIEVGYLRSAISGVGTLVLGGSVGSQRYTVPGVCNLEAFDCASDTTFIDITGQATAEVTVALLLDVAIGGTGNVLYKGQPTVNVSITGTGSVADAN